jgi:quercetin dioxygenase-like cupin family protein
MIRIGPMLMGLALLASSSAAVAQDVPDGLAVEWQGKKPCEKIFEDTQIRVARCSFPPGAVHVRHSHPGYLTCVLSGGKGQIEDANGKRLVEPRANTCTNSPPIPWHELTNVGDTTLSYLIVERKYEPGKYEPVGGTTQTISKWSR